ncbi:MAG: rhomboid family intramembrane serine protease [Flavobacteriaceae bacterium]|nr:rhomboid family intramembrane serine protease [Flavobacteriaceae bacterium]
MSDFFVDYSILSMIMSLLNQIKEKIKTVNSIERLIYAIITVFIVQNLAGTFSFFQNKYVGNFIVDYFSLAVSSNFLIKSYTLITYSFLHGGFIHLIFNLIMLYYIGNLFLDYFDKKKLLIYFFLGSIFGGLFFILSYNYFKVFENENAYLVGASASITAIMVGLAAYIPNYEMNFRFIGFVKLWILTVVWVFLSFILIPNGNAGGQIAHLGGAFIGFVLTKYIFNENKSKFTFNKVKQTNLKTVYKTTNFYSNYQKEKIKQRKIDRLLDKISKSGYEVLSDDEKSFLDSVSKN